MASLLAASGRDLAPVQQQSVSRRGLMGDLPTGSVLPPHPTVGTAPAGKQAYRVNFSPLWCGYLKLVQKLLDPPTWVRPTAKVCNRQEAGATPSALGKPEAGQAVRLHVGWRFCVGQGQEGALCEMTSVPCQEMPTCYKTLNSAVFLCVGRGKVGEHARREDSRADDTATGVGGGGAPCRRSLALGWGLGVSLAHGSKPLLFIPRLMLMFSAFPVLCCFSHMSVGQPSSTYPLGSADHWHQHVNYFNYLHWKDKIK